MFSIDTESGFTDAVYITWCVRPGGKCCPGGGHPDQFYVFQTHLNKGFKPILERNLGQKKNDSSTVQTGTKQTKVSPADKAKFVINDEEC